MSRSPDWDPYEVLGLEYGASDEAVQTAFRTMTAIYHPDRYSDSPQDAQAWVGWSGPTRHPPSAISPRFAASQASSNGKPYRIGIAEREPHAGHRGFAMFQRYPSGLTGTLIAPLPTVRLLRLRRAPEATAELPSRRSATPLAQQDATRSTARTHAYHCPRSVTVRVVTDTRRPL